MSDRKYRHSGYQDTPRTERSKPQGPRPEPLRERIEGAPRGRSAGAPGPEVFKCNRCGQVQVLPEGVAEDACCACGADLHSCSNCKNFDATVHWECRAEINARVSPKDVRNKCGLFSQKIVRDLAADKGSQSQARPQSGDDGRKAFEDLFKK